MKILIGTVLWKRHELFKKFVRHHNQFDADILVIGSDGNESESLCKDLGCHYLEHPNLPLKSKYNRRIDFFLEHTEYTHLLMLGSDDFIDPHAFNYIAKNCNLYDIISWSDLWIYGTHEDELLYLSGYKKNSARVGEPYAPGRCISRKVMEELGGKLWDTTSTISPDRTLWEKLKQFPNQKIIDAQSLGGFIVDVKGDYNINSYSAIKHTRCFSQIIKSGMVIEKVRQILKDE